ncbi:hypothetical protein QYZ87_01290 [Porphyromonadaceae bacterium W3.11]|nr:hypothetical protein [Porphyromonadaceae bacterium W3.11]
MKRIVIITISLWISIFTVRAIELAEDTIPVALRLQERYNLYHLFVKTYTENPSLKHYSVDTDLTTFGVSYDWRHESKALEPSKGDGYKGFTIGADAYKRLSHKKVVWGYATYDKDIVKNVRWNSTAHVDKLYPYIIGNDNVGDMKCERYAFLGGYAQQYAWGSWGLEMEYLAGHQFRTIDPRPRIVTSDLMINTGASLNLTERYLLGIKFGIESYKQRAGFTFYDELGADPQYILSGLGNIFERFNESKLQMDYRSKKLLMGINLLPRAKNGLYLDLEAEMSGLERILTSANNVPINSYKEAKGVLHTGYWSTISEQQRWGINIDGSYQRRKGKSHIIGDPKGGSYPIEARLPMFGMEIVTSSVTGYYEQQLESWWWHCSPKISYQKSSIAIAYPQKQLDDHNLDYSISGGWGIKWHKNMADINLSFGYIQHINSSLVLPKLLIRQSLLEHIEESYSQLSHDRVYCTISPKIFFQVSKNMGLELNMAYRMVHLAPQNIAHQLAGGVTLVF